MSNETKIDYHQAFGLQEVAPKLSRAAKKQLRRDKLANKRMVEDMVPPKSRSEKLRDYHARVHALSPLKEYKP